MLVLAFFTASSLASRQALKEGFDPEKIFNLCFWVFISGIIGSRLFYIIYSLPFYIKHPIEIVMLQHGGMAIFGGIIFGCICAWVFIRLNRMSPLLTLDLLAPFIVLGQAIGRIGCFLNGCCYGKPSVFGLYFPSAGQKLIPTQLYSSLALFVIFLVLRRIQNREHLPGSIFCFYLFFYSIKRFTVEFLRNDSPKMFAGLTIFQLFSLAMFFISLALLVNMFYPGKKKVK